MCKVRAASPNDYRVLISLNEDHDAMRKSIYAETTPYVGAAPTKRIGHDAVYLYNP